MTKKEKTLKAMCEEMAVKLKDFRYREFVYTALQCLGKAEMGLVIDINHTTEMLAAMGDVYAGNFKHGEFIMNVVKKDFYEAMLRADNSNMWAMPIYGMFIRQYAPIGFAELLKEVYNG